MPNRNGQPPGQPTPTPVVMDLHAAAPQLLDRAAQDYAAQQAANRTRNATGGTEARQGILHGEGN